MASYRKRCAQSHRRALIRSPEIEKLVLFDGECGLCDRTVQWLLCRDRRRVLRYAPLQGETARAILGAQPDLETMLFVRTESNGDRRIYRRSRAMFMILRELGGGWRLVSWLRVLPAFLTDLPYRLVARLRMKIWGRRDACRIPESETQELFLP